MVTSLLDMATILPLTISSWLISLRVLE